MVFASARLALPITISDSRTSWWSLWREVQGTIVVHVDLTPHADRESQAVALLDDAETARWHRLLSVSSRREFALCRSALRINLSECLGCTPRQLSFDRLEHGKLIAKVAGLPVDMGFNVSHSGRHGLIAIAKHDCLGVDVEERVSHRDLEGIGRLVYGPAERQCLKLATGREKLDLFYRLWSMKEALMKALGTGFSLRPSEFQIPGPMLRGVRCGKFRFPHLPLQVWQLLDLGEPRFAAALAYRVPSSSRLTSEPPSN